MGKFVTKSEKESSKMTKIILKELGDKNLILLIGNLRAGKTTITKAIAQELGIKEDITSPTYAIKNEYKGLTHYDLYLSDKKVKLGSLLEEDLEKGIVIIEWADKLPRKVAKRAITVNINILDENQREFIIK